LAEYFSYQVAFSSLVGYDTSLLIRYQAHIDIATWVDSDGGDAGSRTPVQNWSCNSAYSLDDIVFNGAVPYRRNERPTRPGGCFLRY